MLHADIHFEEPHTLGDQLRAFWESEALGIRDMEESIYDEFTGVVKFQNRRNQVPLHGRVFHDPLLNYYELSLQRLQCLLHQHKQDPAVLKEYDDIIKDQLKIGIIEAIPNEDPLNNVLYMLHHAVVLRDKYTMKVYVVYDVLAKMPHSPLNDSLFKGPNLIN